MINLAIQLFSLLVLITCLVVLFPALWRLFSRKTLMLDPVKVSMWFLSLTIFNSFLVRQINGGPIPANSAIKEWPIASFLVHCCLLAAVVVIFITEKAIFRAREP